MSGLPGITSKRGRPAAAVVLAATLFPGTLAAPANAEEPHWTRRDHQRRDDRRHDRDHDYYRAPPVVHGTPYYAPPVVYGPA